MAIHTSCPKCQAASEVPDEYLGRKVQCQRCKQIYAVEAPMAEMLPVGEPPAVSRPRSSGTHRAASSRRHVPVRSAPPPKKSTAAAWAIGIVVSTFVLLVLVGTIGVAWWALNNVFKEEAKAPPQRPNVAGTLPQGRAGGQSRNPFEGMDDGDDGDDGKNQAAPFEVKDLSKSDAGYVDLHPKMPLPKSDGEAAPAPRGEAGLPDDVRVKVKSATPRLAVTEENNQQGEGSGFFVAPGILITNRHVVGMLEPGRGKPKKIDVILDGGEKTERTLKGEVLTIHPRQDLAVVQVKGDKLPAPLTVAGAQSLRETQRIYTVGYPMGSERTKNVSIREASVNAIMKDKNGEIRMVGVEGGMYHGNSGGPVVDVRGYVIGVSVSGYPDANGRLGLNNAIPAEFVHDLLGGSVERLSLEYPIRQEEQLSVPYMVKVTDPLKRMTKMDLEWWTGDKGDERPGSWAEPQTVAGDSPRNKQTLTLTGGMTRGTLQFPVPPEGKVVWMRTVTDTEKGEKRWSSAVAYSPPPPLQNKKLAIAVKSASSAPGKLQVALKADLNAPIVFLSSAAGILRFEVDVGAQIAETPGRGGLVSDYKEFDIGARMQERPARGRNLLFVIGQLFGNTESTLPSTVEHLPQRSQMQARGVVPWLNNLIDAIAVPPVASTDQPWKAERKIPIGKLGEGEKAVTINFKTIGTRQNNGREEAAVNIDGRSADGQASLRGLAWVDAASGQVVLIRVRFEFQVATEGQGPSRDRGKSGGTMEIRVQRTVGKDGESS